MFDLDADPHEVHDISDDPAHEKTIARLRAAMHAWMSNSNDWSDESEADMIARFEPNGEQQLTPAPSIDYANGTLTLTPAAPGHSMMYRVNDGAWRLYVAPIKVGEVVKLEALAVRYGWKSSEIVAAGS